MFLEYVGEENVRKMEQRRRDIKRARHERRAYNGHYQKKPKNIVHSALEEISKIAVKHSFTYSRIGGRHKRLSGYRFYPTLPLEEEEVDI